MAAENFVMQTRQSNGLLHPKVEAENAGGRRESGGSNPLHVECAQFRPAVARGLLQQAVSVAVVREIAPLQTCPACQRGYAGMQKCLLSLSP